MRFFLLIAAMVLQGCQAATPVDQSSPVDAEAEAARIEQVLSGLSERAKLLEHIHGWGVIELQWADDQGSHFEQGDLEFWIDGNERLAVRISKLGDTYFWIGTDGVEAWVFDLSDRPRRLLSGSMQAIQESAVHEGSWLSILDMIRMMRAGLGALPPPAREDVLSLGPGEDGALLLLFRDNTDSNRRVRMELSPNTWRPTQLSLLNSNGTSLITAGTRSSRTKRVVIPGRSSLASPIISAVLEVRDEAAVDTLARFAFEGMTTDLSDQPLNRIFDMDILRKSLRPEVEGPLLELENPEDDSKTH
ncbi:MAG: hypothetical protein P8M22_07045 [Phycisphaerales bacterium]|nr:hypothetical protein [Phycisphaerales bacterium]